MKNKFYKNNNLIMVLRDETWIQHWLSVVLLNFSNINEIIPLKIKKPLEDSHFGSFINNCKKNVRVKTNLLKKKESSKKGFIKPQFEK